MNKLKLAIISLVTLFLLWIASWFGLFGLLSSDKNAPTTSSSPTQMVGQSINLKVIENNSEIINFSKPYSENSTPFSLLEEATTDHSIEIKTTKYDFGIFVNSINGVEGNDQMFWKYYVNDEEGTVASDNFILSPGDQVKWVYEEVKY